MQKHTIAYTKKNGSFPSFSSGEYANQDEAKQALEKLAGAAHTPHRLEQDGSVYFGRVMAQKDFNRL